MKKNIKLLQRKFIPIIMKTHNQGKKITSGISNTLFGDVTIIRVGIT